MLEYNRAFVEHALYEKYLTTKYPDRKIAILSCMDTRMTELLPAALGLKNGDVKLIKNAGGRVTSPYDSAMFSLLVAVYELGVDTILVIGHDDCGGCGLNGAHMVSQMRSHGISPAVMDSIRVDGKTVEEWLTGFGDVTKSVQYTVHTIQTHPLMHQDISVLGFVMDPVTGLLRAVDAGEHPHHSSKSTQDI